MSPKRRPERPDPGPEREYRPGSEREPRPRSAAEPEPERQPDQRPEPGPEPERERRPDQRPEPEPERRAEPERECRPERRPEPEPQQEPEGEARHRRPQRHNPASLPPPTGFSHAVTATGSRLVFLAGQTALDPAGAVVGESLPEQFETALTNLLTALAAAGGTPRDLARVTVWTTDVEEYRAHSAELGPVIRSAANSAIRPGRVRNGSRPGLSASSSRSTRRPPRAQSRPPRRWHWPRGCAGRPRW